jgi:nitrogen fixation/metabolism regulation signal transduction histidine kinase
MDPEYPGKASSMHLRLFWRVILAQSTLIALLLIISAYALSQLAWLTNLNTDIFVVDMTCIEHEKRLLKIFLAQMRNAEKYVLLRDKAFYEQFVQDNGDFGHTREQIAALINTDQERALLEQITTLHTRYGALLMTALSRQSRWSQEKTDLSDGITAGLSNLIRVREELVAQKTAAARAQTAVAARTLGWLTPGGIALAIVLSYFHAHSISQPLRKLTRALRRVGTGDFRRSLTRIRGPKEVDELAQAFNWMSSRLAELDRMKTDFMAMCHTNFARHSRLSRKARHSCSKAPPIP